MALKSETPSDFLDPFGCISTMKLDMDVSDVRFPD